MLLKIYTLQYTIEVNTTEVSVVYSVNGTIDNSNCVQNQNNGENQAVKPEIIIGEGGYGSGFMLD